MVGADAAVAIYWDFENVHACMVDDADGDGAYRSTRFKPQEPVVDIDPVMEYAATFGRVVVHRAYANWQYFGRYRDELQAHAIDLVQMFPLAGSKNGADIRLVLDVVEDMQHHPHLTHVLVVASDSDYTSLAQRCRKHGLYFLGVGTERTAGSYQFACDEFRRYRDIAGASAAARPAQLSASTGREVAPLEDAADLVVRAIRRLAAGSGESWVRKAGVRPLVKRLDPTFDESGFGFPTFTELLKALDAAGYVAERAGEHDHELTVRAEMERPALDGTALDGTALDGTALDGTALAGSVLDHAVLGRPGLAGHPDGGVAGLDDGQAGLLGYQVAPQGSASAALVERQLRRRGLRLPADRRILWELPDLMVRSFGASQDSTAASFDSLRLAVEESASQLGLAVTEAEFNKVKSILLHARAFTLLGRDRGISLQVPDATHLRSLIVGQLLRHLADPADEDSSVLAEAFFGPAASEEQREARRHRLERAPRRPGPGRCRLASSRPCPGVAARLAPCPGAGRPGHRRPGAPRGGPRSGVWRQPGAGSAHRLGSSRRLVPSRQPVHGHRLDRRVLDGRQHGYLIRRHGREVFTWHECSSRVSAQHVRALRGRLPQEGQRRRRHLPLVEDVGGEHHVGRSGVPGLHVQVRDGHGHLVAGRVRRDGAERVGVDVARRHRRGAGLRGGDRHQPGPGGDVQHALAPHDARVIQQVPGERLSPGPRERPERRRIPAGRAPQLPQANGLGEHQQRDLTDEGNRRPGSGRRGDRVRAHLSRPSPGAARSAGGRAPRPCRRG